MTVYKKNLLQLIFCFSLLPSTLLPEPAPSWRKREDGAIEIFREPASWGLQFGGIATLLGGGALAYYLPEVEYKIAGGCLAVFGSMLVWNAKRKNDLVDKPFIILQDNGMWMESVGFIPWYEVAGYDILNTYHDGIVSSRYLQLELTNKRYVKVYTFGAPLFHHEIAIGPRELINLLSQFLHVQ